MSALKGLIRRFVARQGQCALQRLTGTDMDGVQTFGGVVLFDAYVEERDVESHVSGYGSHILLTLQEVGPEDRIWLPGANTLDNAERLKPLSVRPVTDPRTGKLKHYEIVVTR